MTQPPGQRPRMWNVFDLASTTDLVSMLWPGDDPGRVASHRAQINMWARRRKTTGFPDALATLACGPLFSRRQVAAWWTVYRVSNRYRAALRRETERTTPRFGRPGRVP